jgi:hypothetical protein
VVAVQQWRLQQPVRRVDRRPVRGDSHPGYVSPDDHVVGQRCAKCERKVCLLRSAVHVHVCERERTRGQRAEQPRHHLGRRQHREQERHWPVGLVFEHTHCQRLARRPVWELRRGTCTTGKSGWRGIWRRQGLHDGSLHGHLWRGLDLVNTSPCWRESVAAFCLISSSLV